MSRRGVLMEALTATPRDLARVLRRVDEVQAQRRANGSSIRDVIVHIREEEALTLARWQRAVAHNYGEPESLDTLGTEPNEQKSLADLVADFAARRAATLTFLSELEQRQWGIVLHRDGISVRLRDDVQALVTHDNEHLNQLLELRDQSAR